MTETEPSFLAAKTYGNVTYVIVTWRVHGRA